MKCKHYYNAICYNFTVKLREKLGQLGKGTSLVNNFSRASETINGGFLGAPGQGATRDLGQVRRSEGCMHYQRHALSKKQLNYIQEVPQDLLCANSSGCGSQEHVLFGVLGACQDSSGRSKDPRGRLS